MITLRVPDDPGEAKPLLRVLRHSLSEGEFDARLAAAIRAGYRTLVAEDDGLIAALGYRIVEDICWGRTFYIDDLVVAEARRSEGIGEMLMTHATESARAEECDCVRLCSGLARTDAHRFYETNGMERTSLQFVARLTES